MKVVIQIPCLDEEATLPAVLADLPRDLPGIDQVEWLVVDDGSADRTSEVARSHGADHVVRLPCNRGLAVAYLAGLEEALRVGADVIVNTDGDNQYRGADVGRLVAPIVAGRADLVIGDRQVASNPEFTGLRRQLQRLGSWSVRQISGVAVADAPSGFRAMTREVALHTTLHGRFSYTLETLIQAGTRRWTVLSVPIRTNPRARESRLFGSAWVYLRQSAALLVRGYAMASPLRAFLLVSLPFFAVSGLLGVRWLWLWVITPPPTGHVQSLVVATVCLLVGLQIALFGLLGDLLAANRRLGEELLVRIRRLELAQGAGGGDEQGEDEG